MARNNAGELYFRGISGAGAAIGQGINDTIRQYQQNKMMGSQAIAKFEGAMKANPDLMQTLSGNQAPPEVSKAFSKLQKEGSLGARDAALLAQFADSYSAEKQQIQQNEMRKAQMDAARTQMDADKVRIDQAKRDQAMLEQLKQLGQFSTGAGTGVLRADVQDPMRAQLASNPFLRTASQLAQATGRAPGPEELLQFSSRQSPGFDVVTVRSADDKGNPIEITYDKNTRKEIARGPLAQQPRAYPTPEEAAQTELLKTEAQESAKSQSELFKRVQDQAESARVNNATIGRIRDYYKEGATTGFGQEWLTKGRSLLAGMGVDDKKLGNQQAIQAEINRLYFEMSKGLTEGGGSVSDNERAALKDSMANPNLSPEGNMLILDSLFLLGERAQKMEDERMKMEEQELSKKVISQRLLKLRSEMPLPGLARLSQLNAVGAPAPATGGSGWTPEKEARLRELESKRK